MSGHYKASIFGWRPMQAHVCVCTHTVGRKGCMRGWHWPLPNSCFQLWTAPLCMLLFRRLLVLTRMHALIQNAPFMCSPSLVTYVCIPPSSMDITHALPLRLCFNFSLSCYMCFLRCSYHSICSLFVLYKDLAMKRKLSNGLEHSRPFSSKFWFKDNE